MRVCGSDDGEGLNGNKTAISGVGFPKTRTKTQVYKSKLFEMCRQASGIGNTKTQCAQIYAARFWFGKVNVPAINAAA